MTTFRLKSSFFTKIIKNKEIVTNMYGEGLFFASDCFEFLFSYYIFMVKTML